MKTILAGVSVIEYVDPSTGDLILTAKTLTDSAINATASELAIAAGQGGGTIGYIYHSTALEISSTDAIWDLKYLKMKFGTPIEIGGVDFTVETVTTTLNTITVAGNPQPFLALGKVGWYKLPTETDDEWKNLTFLGKVATTTIGAGVDVCVKYSAIKSGMKQIRIPADMLPQIVYARMSTKQYKSSVTGAIDTSSTVVGNLVTEIPQFQFNPNLNLTLGMTTASNMQVGGKALVNFDNSCNGSGNYYAIMKEDIFSANWYDTVQELKATPVDVDLVTGETELLKVFGLYDGGTYSQVANTDLVFTSSDVAVATVVNGLITFVGVGDATITISIADKAGIIEVVNVTCS